MNLGEEALGSKEFGQLLGLLMTVPLVTLSYLLVRPEIAAFALVPGITALSLTASQGDEGLARAGFTAYLPLALLAMGYAMLFAAAPARRAARACRKAIPGRAAGTALVGAPLARAAGDDRGHYDRRATALLPAGSLVGRASLAAD